MGIWLRSREPAPPEPLAVALEGLYEPTSTAGARRSAGPSDADALVDALAVAGLDRLRRAVARPGRERESAYRLLEADALLTYACEAALEHEDAPAMLRRVLALSSG